jgi:hypothetical protein
MQLGTSISHTVPLGDSYTGAVPRVLVLTVSVAAFQCAFGILAAQGVGRLAPVPREPIDAIIDAFQSHAIVAIGEPHGDEQFHALRLALLRDRRFLSTVNDIVVESGNARYQETMDRFVRGESVPYDSLRAVWQDTTASDPVWDVPMYEEFYRAVRAANEHLPNAGKVRVLLGDPPIDWRSVTTFAELDRWLTDRDEHPTRVIRDEVLAKHRRALIIYGDGHVWRNIPRTTVTSLLESTQKILVFVIATATDADWKSLDANADKWRVPSILLVRDTALGAFGFSSFYRRPGPGNPWRTLHLEDEADAVLYLGIASGMTSATLPAALCADPTYRAMRLRRMALDGVPPSTVLQRFKRYCREP